MKLKVVKTNFTVKDIMKHVLNACKNVQNVDLNLNNEKEIYDFLSNKLIYAEDGDKYQVIQMPNALLKNGFGDCKSFTVFASHCLNKLGIPHNIVFCNFHGQNPNSWHVFVQTKSCVLDGTNPDFNKLPLNMKKVVKHSIIPNAVGMGLQVMGKTNMSPERELTMLAQNLKRAKMSGYKIGVNEAGRQIENTLLKIADNRLNEQVDISAQIQAPLALAMLLNRSDRKMGVAPAVVAVAAVKYGPLVYGTVSNIINSAQNKKWAANWAAFGNEISKLMEKGFDPNDYMAKNPDVKEAVTRGSFLRELPEVEARAAGHFVEAVLQKNELRIGGFPYLDLEFLSRNLAGRYPQAKRLFLELQSFPNTKNQVLGQVANGNQVASDEAKYINSEWAKVGHDAFKNGDQLWQPFLGNEEIQTTSVQSNANIAERVAAASTGVAMQMEQRISANFDLFNADSWQQLAQALNLPERNAKRAVSLVRRFKSACLRLQRKFERNNESNLLINTTQQNVLLYCSGMPNGIPQRYLAGPDSALKAARRAYNDFTRNFANAIAGLTANQVQANAADVRGTAAQMANEIVSNPQQAPQLAQQASQNIAQTAQQVVQGITGIKIPTVQQVRNVITSPQTFNMAINTAASLIKPAAGGKGLTFDKAGAAQAGIGFGLQLAQNLFT